MASERPDLVVRSRAVEQVIAADVPDGATAFRCCPPIRGRADSDGLWQGVGKARSVRPDSRAIVTR